MTEKSQQVKKEFYQRWEKVSQWVGKPFLWCAEIVTSIQFLFLLLLVFSLALYHPPFADSLLSIVIDKYSGKIIPFVPAIATILGLLLFAQRLDVMNKQAETAQDHIEATQDQHEVVLFKQACELLGHEKMVTRIGGITLLGVLARTDPETWHVAAVDTLALFIRNRSAEDKTSPIWFLSEFLKTTEENKEEADKKWKEFNEAKANEAPADIAEAMRVIACDLTNDQKNVVQNHLKKIVSISDFRENWPDLNRSWLCFIDLNGTYLPKADLMNSFLCLSELHSADLTDALLNNSHLNGTFFNHTKFQNTKFGIANVTSADFDETTGLETCNLKNWYYVENKKPRNLPDKFKPDPRADKDYRNIIRTCNDKRVAILFRALDNLET